jgi:UDP-2-acetamido-2,6-beta-L-arabino-hexul-4-ose reductase
MNILITGANGFIGKNLCVTLQQQGHTVFPYDKDDNEETLDDYIKKAEFVYHLAGINRPQDPKEFYSGNGGFTGTLLKKIQKRKLPIVITSSIQAANDSDYGKSKKEAEDLVLLYGKQPGVEAYVFRLSNVFGKWCAPNYNSVIATFCYNIAHDLEIKIADNPKKIPFVYIDDVVTALIDCLKQKGSDTYLKAKPIYYHTVAEVAEIIQSFKGSRKNYQGIEVADPFIKKLYSTYLSYLPTESFSYDLLMHKDERGSFTEFLKGNFGQVSVNVANPGITKGNHWHHTKNEKFLVIKGEAVIRLRQIFSDEVIEVPVSEDQFEVVDIPCGYTHNITNTGNSEMIFFIWANEAFDPDHPDTWFMEV